MERRRYDQARAIRHASLGLIRAPQVGAVFEALEEICGSNRQDGDGVRPAAGLDALPSLGKATAALAFGRALAASRGVVFEKPPSPAPAPSSASPSNGNHSR
ncbi:MAG TPA: hypothetical protein VHZ03_56090 [Trebonia sp.]|jgi:hypothetical protein|nr:hypothetical protein [Trebonia sp.]